MSKASENPLNPSPFIAAHIAFPIPARASAQAFAKPLIKPQMSLRTVGTSVGMLFKNFSPLLKTQVRIAQIFLKAAVQDPTIHETSGSTMA